MHITHRLFELLNARLPGAHMPEAICIICLNGLSHFPDANCVI